MSAPGDYQVDIWHETSGTWGVLSYSITAADVSRFMTYEWTFQENNPKGLTVTLSNGDLGTFNLLDPTFNAWSNSVVGAVDNGDIVAFALTPQGRTDLPYIFYGIVTDVQPDITNRTLTLVCNDFLQRYEGIKSDKIVFANYRDKMLTNYALTTQAGWYALTGITDPNIALPFVSVEFAADDAQIKTFSSASPTNTTIWINPIAQAFVIDAKQQQRYLASSSMSRTQVQQDRHRSVSAPMTGMGIPTLPRL